MRIPLSVGMNQRGDKRAGSNMHISEGKYAIDGVLCVFRGCEVRDSTVFICRIFMTCPRISLNISSPALVMVHFKNVKVDLTFQKNWASSSLKNWRAVLSRIVSQPSILCTLDHL